MILRGMKMCICVVVMGVIGACSPGDDKLQGEVPDADEANRGSSRSDASYELVFGTVQCDPDDANHPIKIAKRISGKWMVVKREVPELRLAPGVYADVEVTSNECEESYREINTWPFQITTPDGLTMNITWPDNKEMIETWLEQDDIGMPPVEVDSCVRHTGYRPKDMYLRTRRVNGNDWEILEILSKDQYNEWPEQAAEKEKEEVGQSVGDRGYRDVMYLVVGVAIVVTAILIGCLVLFKRIQGCTGRKPRA